MTLVLDAGAIIGFERSDRDVSLILNGAKARGERLVVPATVVAQVWRSGSTQARVAMLLKPHRSEIVPLDSLAAKGVGYLLARSRTTNVVDASVVWCARRRNATVVTTDPADLRRIDPRVQLETV